MDVGYISSFLNSSDNRKFLGEIDELNKVTEDDEKVLSELSGLNI